MSSFDLGQRVTMSGTVEKVREYPHTRYVESDIPHRIDYPNNRTYSEGVIVGSRTIQEGIASYDDENGRQFDPTIGKARRVWLVAYDLRRKPVMCFDHQVRAMPKEPTVTVPVPNIPHPGPSHTAASHMRGAAQKIDQGYAPGGSNVTAAVLKLLRDTADAIEETA